MHTATLSPSRTVALREHVSAPTGRIDSEAGVIYGVRVLGRESSNGRTYTDQAMRDACKLYENVGVNVDHPEARNASRERSLRESVGWLQNCRCTADGVFADLHLLKHHPDTGWILERATRAPRFGLSHNAEGETVRRDGKLFVESVSRVHSVDLVGRPATNNGLFESIPGGHSPDAGTVDDFEAGILAVVRDRKKTVQEQLKIIGEILRAANRLRDATDALADDDDGGGSLTGRSRVPAGEMSEGFRGGSSAYDRLREADDSGGAYGRMRQQERDREAGLRSRFGRAY